MTDDEHDGPARPPSRGPRVVTGEMKRQAGGGRASTRTTATGWAPVAPPPADAEQDDPGPAAEGDRAETLVGPGPQPAPDGTLSETLVGPAPVPSPAAYEPRRPRVVTGRTQAVAATEAEAADAAVGDDTQAVAPPPRAAATTTRPASPPPSRPAPPPPPVWHDDDDLLEASGPGGSVPPPVHRSAAPPTDLGRPAPTPAAPATSAVGGKREPLAARSLLLAVLSIPLAGILAIPALLLARRAKRRIAGRPGTTGAGLVTAARVVAVFSLLGWLIVAGVVVASLVRPDGVDYAKLKPGDCFDTPDGTEVRRLTVRACDDAHDAEVFAVVTHPGAADDAFPGADALLAYAVNACLGQPFTDYVGIPRGQSKLTEFEIVPESEAWFEGRRGLVCAVDNADRSPLTASVKGTAQ